jgi:hypothetical protein
MPAMMARRGLDGKQIMPGGYLTGYLPGYHLALPNGRKLNIPRVSAGPAGYREIVLSVQLDVVIVMPWWEAVLFFAAVILAIWGFASLVGFRTRMLTRRTDRTAQDLYGQYADSPRKQRRFARQHGGDWHSE